MASPAVKVAVKADIAPAPKAAVVAPKVAKVEVPAPAKAAKAPRKA